MLIYADAPLSLSRRSEHWICHPFTGFTLHQGLLRPQGQRRGLATSTLPPGASSSEAMAVAGELESPSSSLRPLAYWLLGTGTLVAGMVTIGGITRLTRSGLSMTDWKIQVRRRGREGGWRKTERGLEKS